MSSILPGCWCCLGRVLTQCPAQSHNVWPVTISVSAFKSSFIAPFDTDLVYFIYVLRVNVREKNRGNVQKVVGRRLTTFVVRNDLLCIAAILFIRRKIYVRRQVKIARHLKCILTLTLVSRLG